jgi:diguanylate cyclase (GGDEF)-like protein
MRLRFWIGISALVLIGLGSVAAALVVHRQESDSFHQAQRAEAIRSARQAEAVAGQSVRQLASAAAFFQAEKRFGQHEFRIVARPLLGEGALHSTAFVERRGASFVVAFSLGEHGVSMPVGLDLGGDPLLAPFLRRARDSGTSAATRPVPLPGGGLGIDVYRPVYRDGAPTATVAERRAALTGFAAGAFRLRDLARVAAAALPAPDDVQLRVGGGSVVGDRGQLDDPSRAQIQIADRAWVLVVSDPNRPDVGLPLLIGGVGFSMAALLAALILIWSRNEKMQRLEREASHDPLTGLRNRRSFEAELRREMARSRRSGTTGAMLMIDLDNFKRINDTHGHPAGDRLLKEVAGLLSNRVRETDVLARLGGDEFAISLPDTGVAEAQVVAESVVDSVRGRSWEKIEDEVITASVGIAMFGDDPRLSYESIASEADTAMYAAKDSGGNGFRVFHPHALRAEAPEPGSPI